VISPTAFEKNGEEWANYNPVGTGPFKMVEFKRNVSIKFEKFKDYYEEGLPYLDGIHIIHIADPMTAASSLKRGEVDGWMNVEQIMASELAKGSQWDVSTGFGPYYLINFNSSDPESPWSKLKMREALEYAIDREAVARVTGRGFRFPVWTVLYGLDPKKVVTTPRKYNPDKAIQLMNEAGYPKGLNIKLFHMAGQEKDAATIFQGYLDKVGIKTQLEALAGAAWHGKLFEPIKGSELVWGFLPGNLISPLQSAYQAMTEKSPLFQTVKRPEGFNEALARAFSKEDINSGMEDLSRAEKLAYEFAMLCPVLVTKFVALNAPYVKDAYWFYATAPRPNFKYAWLER
jgi:ABC-type transport system substrate-binding protein